jgi:hypothetical protein
MISKGDYEMLWEAWEQGFDLGEVLNQIGKALHGGPAVPADVRAHRKAVGLGALNKGAGLDVLTRLQGEVERVRLKLQVAKAAFSVKRENPNDLRAVGDMLMEHVRKDHGEDIGIAHNHMDLSANASAIGTTTIKSKQKLNRNIPVGDGYAKMMGVPQGEELVKARANCARLCKNAGRTACRYCAGQGFAAMNAPSRSINKARHYNSQAEGGREL